MSGRLVESSEKTRQGKTSEKCGFDLLSELFGTQILRLIMFAPHSTGLRLGTPDHLQNMTRVSFWCSQTYF